MKSLYSEPVCVNSKCYSTKELILTGKIIIIEVEFKGEDAHHKLMNIEDAT